MEQNMGLADRIIRTAVASVIVELCATKKQPVIVKGMLTGFSVFLIITSLTGSCPAMNAMGMNSKSDQEAEGLFL